MNLKQDWQFRTIVTQDGFVINESGPGFGFNCDDSGKPYEFCVKASCVWMNGNYGVFGWGHTEEEARQDAERRAARMETEMGGVA